MTMRRLFEPEAVAPAVEPLAAPHYALEREPMDRFSNDRTREVNRQQGCIEQVFSREIAV